MKSPGITPLNETIENLSLNDYNEEVFHLEDDELELDKATFKPPQKQRPTSMTLQNEFLASTSSGKYIPPFRRGSQKSEKRRSRYEPSAVPSSVPSSKTEWFH